MSTHAIQWIKSTSSDGLRVLLIGQPASTIAQQLQEALGHCGFLSVSLNSDSKLIDHNHPYDCYVLDGDYPIDLSETMKNILTVHPDARILVVSDSYDWEDAVNAFRLGAIDVIRTPDSGVLARENLNYVMAQLLPRRNSRRAGV